MYCMLPAFRLRSVIRANLQSSTSGVILQNIRVFIRRCMDHWFFGGALSYTDIKARLQIPETFVVAPNLGLNVPLGFWVTPEIHGRTLFCLCSSGGRKCCLSFLARGSTIHMRLRRSGQGLCGSPAGRALSSRNSRRDCSGSEMEQRKSVFWE